MQAIIAHRIDFPERPKPIILTGAEREKAMERCAYIFGYPMFFFGISRHNTPVAEKHTSTMQKIISRLRLPFI